MDYNEWAQEYYLNARRVKTVIDRRYQQLKEKKTLSADKRKQLSDDLRYYRRIYRELTEIGDALSRRAKGASFEE